MLFHVIPRFYANAGLNPKFVSLESVKINELDLVLKCGEEVVARSPYPNKNYLVACKKKGKKAVDGILVDIGKLREVTVVTTWSYFLTEVVHEVKYFILGDDLGFATTDSMRHVFESHPEEIRDFISKQNHIAPTMSFKPEIYFSQSWTDKVVKDATGCISELSSVVYVPTLTEHEFYNNKLLGSCRLPKWKTFSLKLLKRRREINKKVRVLIIYEVIPDSMYKTVVDLRKEDYDLLKRADSYVVNVSAYSRAKQDASLAINYAFSIQENPCFADTKLQLRFFRRFKSMTSKELAKALSSGVDDVIHSGYLI